MLTLVFGTRPERAKLRTIARNLTSRGVAWQAICSGQHTTLLDGLDHDPDFPTLHDLGFHASGDPVAYRDRLMGTLHDLLRTPIVVQGDTATACAAALAAHRLDLPVFHVEAGLRTHDLSQPWPEEGFRRQISAVAHRHYAPTEGNRQHLLQEGIPDHAIAVTGNPGLDLLVPLLQHRPVPFVPKAEVLVTLHRRESHGDPLTRIVHGLLRTCERFPQYRFLWPVHPNPAIRASLPTQAPQNLVLLPPLAPDTFTALLHTSSAVLTDSGGVQEEAAFLGVPAVIAREKTDRPESLDSGQAVLAGSSPDAVYHYLSDALTGGLRPRPTHVFGDGQSGQRIVHDIIQYL